MQKNTRKNSNVNAQAVVAATQQTSNSTALVAVPNTHTVTISAQQYAALKAQRNVANTQQQQSNSAKKVVNVNARANSSNNTTLVSVIFNYFSSVNLTANSSASATLAALTHVATVLFTQQYRDAHSLQQAVARAKQYAKLYLAQQAAQQA